MISWKYANVNRFQLFFIIQMTWLSIFSLILLFGMAKVYNMTSQLSFSSEDVQTKLVELWRSEGVNSKAHLILQELIIQTDRLWLVDPQDPHAYLNARQLVLDLSSSKEFSIVLNRMKTNINFQNSVDKGEVAKFVVDFGAFNGMTISNSFNWLQMGWDCMQVEPTPSSFANLEKNTAQFPVSKTQRFIKINGAITVEDGPVYLTVSDSSGTQNYLASSGTIKVDGFTPKTLFAQHKVPKNFAMLSIDIETEPRRVLEWVFEAGYSPYYIIMEAFDINIKWAPPGYQIIFKNGLNVIYEKMV